MPARAPTYYHWAKDKPCTTNQDYGFLGKPDMLRRQAEDRLKPKRVEGPFDYARPFSNLGFFPDISEAKALTLQRSKTAPAYKRVPPGVLSSAPGPVNTFDINRGYSMGHVPIPSRVTKRQYPADVKLVRHQSVPSTYQQPVSAQKDLFLWHTLSGCLVHVKNHIPEPKPDAYKRTKAEVRSLQMTC